jgi:hypothetical protein
MILICDSETNTLAVVLLGLLKILKLPLTEAGGVKGTQRVWQYLLFKHIFTLLEADRLLHFLQFLFLAASIYWSQCKLKPDPLKKVASSGIPFPPYLFFKGRC